MIHYCGADLIHTGVSLCMSQERYIKDVLQRVGLKESNIAGTPIDNNVFDQVAEEMKKNEGVVPDKTLVNEAQILVGCIIWVATRTRPDVIFAMSVAASIMTSLPALSIKLSKRVLRYLKGTVALCLIFGHSMRVSKSSSNTKSTISRISSFVLS